MQAAAVSGRHVLQALERNFGGLPKEVGRFNGLFSHGVTGEDFQRLVDIFFKHLQSHTGWDQETCGSSYFLCCSERT